MSDAARIRLKTILLGGSAFVSGLYLADGYRVAAFNGFIALVALVQLLRKRP